MKRILIADDERDIVESVQRMLMPYYTVDVATTGLEILQLCEQHDYSGILIDVDFGPGVSGLEVASLIRSRNKEVRIIIFSAIEYTNAVRQQVVDMGAVFGEKPLTFEFVLRALEA